MSKTVPITELALDPRLQMRVKLDKKTIEQYAQNPAALPAVQVIMDADGNEDGKMWVWDGHHTIEAYLYRGIKEVPVEIRSGTFKDAMIAAGGTNNTHGLPLTDKDKAKKIKTFLAESEWANASSRTIAGICKVSPTFVEKIRGGSSDHADGGSSRTASDGGKATRPPKKPKPDADPSIPDTKAAFGFQMCARCARGNKPACAACIKKHLAVQAKKNRAPDDPFSFTVVYEALQSLRAQKKKFAKQYPDKESMHPEAVDAGIHELRVAFRTWYREATNQKPPEE